MTQPHKILFCNCTYAQVVPPEVKKAVLQKLCESDLAFEAVADLCEMSARRDPTLKALAEGGPLKIAACYPRAVKWLFAAAQAPLAHASTQVCNMRVDSAEQIASALTSSDLNPNVPLGKEGPSLAELPKREAA